MKIGKNVKMYPIERPRKKGSNNVLEMILLTDQAIRNNWVFDKATDGIFATHTSGDILHFKNDAEIMDWLQKNFHKRVH